MTDANSRSEVFCEGRLPSSWFSVDRSKDAVFRSESTEWSVIYRHRWSPPPGSSIEPPIPALEGLPCQAAVKVVDLNFKRVPHDARKEAKLLAKLSHPNVVRLLTALYSYPSLHIHMPLYPLHLADLLDAPSFLPSHPAFTEVARSLLLQLARALSYLHERSVAHRDVAVNNLVLSAEGRLVLVDFGTAWDPVQPGTESASHLEFELGTMPFRAPELVFGSRHYSPKGVDLWAFGAVASSFFTEMETLEPPKPATQRPTQANGAARSTATDWYSAPPQSAIFDPYDDQGSWSLPGSAPLPPKPMKRKTLFKGEVGDFALAGSIFKVLGTPTLESWPEARELPDFSLFEFNSFPARPLDQVLPNLPADSDRRADAVDLIGKLLVYPSESRLSANRAVHHPFFAGALEPEVGTFDDKALGQWLIAWVGSALEPDRDA